MAWGGSTPTLLVAMFANNTNTTAYPIPASGSVSLTSGRLYYIYVHTANASTLTDMSGGTLSGASDQGAFSPTFVRQHAGIMPADPARSAVWRYIADQNRTTVVFTYDPADLGNMACIRAGVVEIASGFDSGTPEQQSADNAANDPNPSQLAVNLGAAAQSDGLSLLFATHCDNTELIDTPSGWTELGEVQGTGSTSDSGSTAIFWDDATQNVTFATNPGTTTNDLGGIHIEVKASGGGPATAVRMEPMKVQRSW